MQWIESLERNWTTILAEYISAQHKRVDYPEYDLYSGSWDVLPFLFFEHDKEGQHLCPKTWELIKDIPGLVTASFSVLSPGTEIAPHTGFTDKVLRYHLALKIPDNCSLIVGGDTLVWEEGKVLVFDDTVEHSAYNHSKEERVVLILDVKKP